MLFAQVETHRLLKQIAVGLTTDAALQDDLVQEALIHLWLREEHCPGHLECWYLQSCRFHLYNYLRNGRSVDAAKRRQSRFALPDQAAVWEGRDDDFASGECVVALVSARDMISSLAAWLTPLESEILTCLADGLSAREVARRFKISHTMVNK